MYTVPWYLFNATCANWRNQRNPAKVLPLYSIVISSSFFSFSWHHHDTQFCGLSKLLFDTRPNKNTPFDTHCISSTVSLLGIRWPHNWRMHFSSQSNFPHWPCWTCRSASSILSCFVFFVVSCGFEELWGFFWPHCFGWKCKIVNCHTSSVGMSGTIPCLWTVRSPRTPNSTLFLPCRNTLNAAIRRPPRSLSPHTDAAPPPTPTTTYTCREQENSSRGVWVY